MRFSIQTHSSWNRMHEFMDPEGFPKGVLPTRVLHARSSQIYNTRLPQLQEGQDHLNTCTAQKFDHENGETVTEHICTIRKPPSLLKEDLCNGKFTKINNNNKFSLTRKPNFRLINGLRLRATKTICSSNKTDYVMERGNITILNKKLHREHIDDVSYTLNFDLLKQLNCVPKAIFKVPAEYLAKNAAEKPQLDPNSVSVDIWEEFMYGEHAINPVDERIEANQRSLIKKNLEKFLPSDIAKFLHYTIYFIVFFASCFVYNSFWQLAGYVLFWDHLMIHQNADKSNIIVRFTGSLFQGPSYALIRDFWCAHCNHQRYAKVAFNYMKDLRREANKFQQYNCA